MTAGGQPSDETEYSRFLIDGLIPSSSPLVLLVTDPASALTVATQLHAGLVNWDELPAATGRLISFATDAAAKLTSDEAQKLCDELVATGHWLYVGDVDTSSPLKILRKRSALSTTTADAATDLRWPFRPQVSWRGYPREEHR